MQTTTTMSVIDRFSSLCVRHISGVCSLCPLFDQHISRRPPKHLPSVLQRLSGSSCGSCETDARCSGVPSLAPRRAVAAPLRLANAPPQCEIFSEAPAAGPTPAFRPAQISALALEIDRFVLAHRYRWRGPRMIKGPTKRQRIQAGSYPGRLSGSSMPYRYRIACKTSSRLHPNGGELVPPLAGSLRRR